MLAAAIIAAGGAGLRFGGGVRKQYNLLAGRPVLAWTLYPFLQCDAVHEIILVAPGEDCEYCAREILPLWDIRKPVRMAMGGRTRQESVSNGLACVPDADGIVLVHDGARPFISAGAVAAGIAECERAGAVIFAVPMTDTVVEAEGAVIRGHLPRERLWRVQTPQIFLSGILRRAFDDAARSGFEATDESALVRRAGFEVRIMEGSPDNIKITVSEDMRRAGDILRGREDLSPYAVWQS